MMHEMWYFSANSPLPALAFNAAGQKSLGIGLCTRCECSYFASLYVCTVA
jgi:hypothetical protein